MFSTRLSFLWFILQIVGQRIGEFRTLRAVWPQWAASSLGVGTCGLAPRGRWSQERGAAPESRRTEVREHWVPETQVARPWVLQALPLVATASCLSWCSLTPQVLARSARQTALHAHTPCPASEGQPCPPRTWSTLQTTSRLPAWETRATLAEQSLCRVAPRTAARGSGAAPAPDGLAAAATADFASWRRSHTRPVFLHP